MRIRGRFGLLVGMTSSSLLTFPALQAELAAAVAELGWTRDRDITGHSVGAHRWGSDGNGGRVCAVLIGNAQGWTWQALDARGVPVARSAGVCASADGAMRAALPFNHTELNP